MKIAILGARVINPETKFDQIANIYIADGKIVAIQPKPLADFIPDKIIDAGGLAACPGIVDLYADLSSLNLEQLSAQLKAAPSVGITHVATLTSQLSLSEIRYLSQKLPGYTRAYLIATLTQKQEGQLLNELALHQQAGCIGFSNGYSSFENTLIKKHCYDYLSMFGAKLYLCPQDPALSKNGCMHQGEVSFKLGLPGIPTLAETFALATELVLLEEVGIDAHFHAISSEKSIKLLEKNINFPLPISCDVAISHLFFTEQQVELTNGMYHVIPPLRTEDDKIYLRDALKSNMINAISSNHLMVSRDKKMHPFQDSAPGMSSWPLLLPLTLKLAEEENLSWIEALSYITCRPAKILGISAGSLKINELADFIIFDPAKNWILTKDICKKFGDNTPFLDKPLKGQVRYAFLGGEFAYEQR